MRRRAVVRLAATLMFAGRDRRSVIRRKAPLTRFASAKPRHSAAGDLSCNGGPPAHRGNFAHPAQPRPGRQRQKIISGCHLRPQEPGQLSGDGSSDDAFGVLALGQVTEAPA